MKKTGFHFLFLLVFLFSFCATSLFSIVPKRDLSPVSRQNLEPEKKCHSQNRESIIVFIVVDYESARVIFYREYNPEIGRWLTPDPAGYVDGMNLYRYYAGVNGVDPLGLDVAPNNPGTWVVEKGDSVWGILQTLRSRGSGDATNWNAFKKRIEKLNPHIKDISNIKPGQRINYRDPVRQAMIEQVIAHEKGAMTSKILAQTGKLDGKTIQHLNKIYSTKKYIARFLDAGGWGSSFLETGSAAIHPLSKMTGMGATEMASFNWNTFRTAYKDIVGSTTRAGQSSAWASFKTLRRIGKGANVAGKAFAGLDLVFNAYLLGESIRQGKNVRQSSKKFLVSGGMFYLTLKGTTIKGVAVAPWLAPLILGTYWQLELCEAKIQKSQLEDIDMHWATVGYHMRRASILKRRLAK